MKISTLTAILHALNHENVRYLVVGGVAVNLHGYQRLTADLDLVIQLDSENIKAALKVFKQLGYAPSVPINAEDFIEKQNRDDWVRNKNMTVLQFWSENYRDTNIDIFIQEPFEFSNEYETSEYIDLDKDLRIKLISLESLIKMKELANRPKDCDDIENLKNLRNEQKN